MAFGLLWKKRNRFSTVVESLVDPVGTIQANILQVRKMHLKKVMEQGDYSPEILNEWQLLVRL